MDREVVDKQAQWLKRSWIAFYSTDPTWPVLHVNIGTIEIVDCGRVDKTIPSEYREEKDADKTIRGVPVKAYLVTDGWTPSESVVGEMNVKNTYQ